MVLVVIICLPKPKTPLEEEEATPSSILAREIPWTEESGGLQSIGLQRVGHGLVPERTHMYITMK